MQAPYMYNNPFRTVAQPYIPTTLGHVTPRRRFLPLLEYQKPILLTQPITPQQNILNMNRHNLQFKQPLHFTKRWHEPFRTSTPDMFKIRPFMETFKYKPPQGLGRKTRYKPRYKPRSRQRYTSRSR